MSVLPSGDTTYLHNKPNLKKPKENPIKKILPKLIKSPNILKQRFNQLKTHKNKDNTDDNTSTKENESSSSDNGNDSDKNPQDKTHKHKDNTYDNPSNKDNASI